MRKVTIIGVGQTPVSEKWDLSLKEIAGEAAFSALVDSGREKADALFIGNMLSGMLSRQDNLGSLVSDWLGLRGVEALKVEAACGSGAAAFRLALMAIGSGEIDSALVIGVEKMSETKGAETTTALATAADADFEIQNGLSFVAINALMMQLYMHKYGWSHRDFAPFSINAHTNAANNPNARLQEPISLEDYINARMIADPINLLDASPIGDGAASVLLVAEDSFPKNKYNQKRSVSLIASASGTDTLSVHSRKDPLWLKAAESSSKMAYRQAGIDAKVISLFELHDAFSIMAALSLESSGFIDRGTAPKLALEGDINLHGKIPISTQGGLKARGHPVGATGIYQIVEVVKQLRGEAEKNQINNPVFGMTQNIGGSGATIITNIFKAFTR